MQIQIAADNILKHFCLFLENETWFIQIVILTFKGPFKIVADNS